VTGQPGQAGEDRPARDRDAAADAEGRSSGNWHKVVDGRDAAPGRDAALGRDAAPGRDAGQARDTRPDRDTAPGRDAGQARDARPDRDASQGRDASEAPETRRPQPPRPAVDLTGEIQKWLIRSGARSMRRELGEQFRKVWSGQQAEPTKPGDVWNAATTEPPPELSEAPECAWCPICRAARRIRESGPGLGGQLAGAGGGVAAAVQEALAAFDSVLSARPRTDPAGGSARPAQADPPEAPAASTPPGGPDHAPPEGPDHEPDDRD
jgi:hypothetical protein